VSGLGLDYKVPILGQPIEDHPSYLWGGVSGTDFLVQSLGLVQPRAGKGLVVPGVIRLAGTREYDAPVQSRIQY
jgi:hypothetical protein